MDAITNGTTNEPQVSHNEEALEFVKGSVTTLIENVKEYLEKNLNEKSLNQDMEMYLLRIREALQQNVTIFYQSYDSSKNCLYLVEKALSILFPSKTKKPPLTPPIRRRKRRSAPANINLRRSARVNKHK